MTWGKMAARAVRNCYDDNGLLKTALFAPLLIIGCWFFIRASEWMKPDDTEKVEAAKRRSAKIDDWSELKSDN